jgi:AbrB family looped-hinge helix DNA binding protein
MVPVRISEQGRLVVPAELRRELGIAGEDALVACVTDGALVIRRREAVLEELWALFADRKLGLEGYLSEKRAEAEREAQHDRAWQESR